MLTLLLTGAGSLLLGALSGYVLGLRNGRQDKMDELHLLQDEGWLTITYNEQQELDVDGSHRGVRTGGVEQDARIAELLHNEPEEVGVRTPSRKRRDSDERRTDWAKHIASQRDEG